MVALTWNPTPYNYVRWAINNWADLKPVVFLFGLIIVLRPSLLKRLEAVLNRWFVTEESIRKLDLQLPTPDSVFGRRPRMMGIIIVAGSLYILMNLWSML
jgi:hypothetical protein